MAETFDVIVVGARCAGSPTAMLLAQKGYRVLLMDHAGFPSDTLSTNLIHAPGVAALRRWHLKDRVAGSRCAAVRSYSFDFGPYSVRGTPPPADGVSEAYAPRRVVLDEMLVHAAAAAGAEVREHFALEGLVVEDGVVVGVRAHTLTGTPVTERARVVVGADGRHSRVAHAVGARAYHELPKLQWSAYTYWSGLPVDGVQMFFRGERWWAAVPTSGGLTLLVVGWPYDQATPFRSDVPTHYLGTLDLAPEFAERVRAARQEDRWAGGGVPNFFRTPYGPGWALVGDAGHTRDPITAQGISDAFLDAEGVARALDDALSGRRPFAEAMGAHHRARDARLLPMHELTVGWATAGPVAPGREDLMWAVSRSPAAADQFAGVYAGTVSPAAFFAPGNVAAVLASAPSGVAAG